MKALDVSHLPDVRYDSTEPVWWANVWMLAIEGTVLALAGASYFYLRLGEREWPPAGTPLPPAGLATVTMALCIVAAVLAFFMDRAVPTVRRRLVRAWVMACGVTGLASLAARWAEWKAVPFLWHSHAYGSVIWTLLFLHTLHLIAATGESIAVTAIFSKGPLFEKHFMDVKCLAVYWYFVAAVWLPLYAFVYWGPRL